MPLLGASLNNIIIAIVIFLLSPILPATARGDARPPSALETGTRKSADTAFRKGQWTGAEKAYLAYSRQMPPLKDVNGALVRVTECRVNRGDAPGVLRALGQVFSDVSAAKREPDARGDLRD